MLDFYKPFQEASANPYVALFARGEGFVISLYKKNDKGEIKALFQGLEAEGEARIWDPKAIPNPVFRTDRFPKLIPVIVRQSFPQIGSDEVGTGDFFGPICVCAAYVRSEDLPLLRDLGVTDSKLMEDQYILSIGPRLISSFEYSQLSLPNDKYNEVRTAGTNMNAIKAKLHNRCLLNLAKKHPDAHLYQDQFAPASLYYHYLGEQEDVARGITFKTKGETAFPSVALASVIARYSFLHKMSDLSEEYKMPIPFGAGADVDVFAKRFVAEYGLGELIKCAKLNFANYKKLI
jgi:ribonuclease HIII